MTDMHQLVSNNRMKGSNPPGIKSVKIRLISKPKDNYGIYHTIHS